MEGRRVHQGSGPPPLLLGLPGQTPLIPIWDPDGKTDQDQTPKPPPPAEPDSWYGKLWTRLDPEPEQKN
ncbi:hypothetical protein ACFQZ4_20605 [Catellatospora coxensis]